MVTSPESCPIGAAPARHILIPLYCAGLWLAVNIAPIGQDSGLVTIREWAERDSYDREPARIGTVGQRDVLAAYAAYLHGLVDLSGIRPLKVVVDAGNGMGGHTVPVVLAGLPLEIVPLYFELDGSFPNHEANPLDPANLVDLQAAVREHGADIGLAFDGDADRVFVVDEVGVTVESQPDIGAVLADRRLQVDQVGRVQGVRLVVGEGAVELEVERDDLQRQAGEDDGDRVPAHAVARVDHDLQGPDARQVDQSVQVGRVCG